LVHQHQTTEKMKTINILIAALFTLQVSVLFAANESNVLTRIPVETAPNLTALAPVTPVEATFEEVPNVTVDLNSLAPVVPVLAEFEEAALVIDPGSLAPVLPAEADFTDTVDQTIYIRSLAPVEPMVADFE
jgi:hypothetical protein